MKINQLRPALRALGIKTSFVRSREGYRVRYDKTTDAVRLSVDFDSLSASCEMAAEVAEALRDKGFTVEHVPDTSWIWVR